MIRPLLKIALTASFLCLACSAFSQTGSLPGSDGTKKPDDKSDDGSSSFKFGVSYLSNNVFMGRSDTTRTPTIIPQVKYTFSNGIYLSGTLDFIPSKKKKKLDGGDIAAGYDFDITDDLSGGASFTKLFYNGNSTQISSGISSTVSGMLTYDIGNIISPSLSADYNFNKTGVSNDVFLNASVAHDFIVAGVFGDADIFLVSPTVAVNTGTQNFYEAYLIKKKVKSAKKTAAQTALLNNYIAILGKYTLLDYELSAPLEYKTGHFIFQFTPTYAVVKKGLPKAIETRLNSQTSTFYFETGIFLKF
jgi:hypothetical protein